MRLPGQVVRDIRSGSPETEVRCHHIEFTDAWDFEQARDAIAQAR